MKVLFLDMDGVLNSARSIRAYGDGGNPLWPYPLDEVAINLVRQVVEETGAYIVISSSWRGGGPADAATWFVNYGWYEVPIIGETPPRRDCDEPRGTCIERWMENRDITRHVIVDDCSDMLPNQNLTLVDGQQGFALRNYHECKRHLL